MRFMILVRGADTLASRMATYREELARAGVLLDASGLLPSSMGWHVRWDDGRQRVVDGPSAQDKEPLAGYALIQVRSRDEALEWSRRFPTPAGEGRTAGIEVRQLDKE